MVLAISIGLLAYGIYVITAMRASIDDIPKEYVFGPDDANLTVVEFMDFTCGDCRGTHLVIMNAVQKDGKIRYIPLPIAGEKTPGAYPMRLCYAAGLQGKYKEVYEALMTRYPAVAEKDLADIAVATGIDADRLKKDMNSRAVNDRVAKTIWYFESLDAKYTPTFLIGGSIKYVPRRVATENDFQSIFQEARKP